MKPLTGVRVAVTRPRAQADELTQLLRDAGASVAVCPLIRIEPHTIGALPEVDWIVLTSVNGVDLLMVKAGLGRGERERELHNMRFAVVGAATAERLAHYGFAADIIPATHTGEALATALIAHADIRGKRVLLARASGGGQDLPRLLRNAGAEVFDVELYRSVLDEAGSRQLQEAISEGKIDLITFTSGSAITYFVQTAGNLPDIRVAVIGPSTATVAHNLGLRVDIEADPHTSAGLVAAIVRYYGGLNAGK